MTTQRHIIKRQVVELQISRTADAQQLQIEVSRIYRQRLVPLIDRYCTELSDPDLIHRIDSLELNLGAVHPQHLEEDLVAKVSTQLQALLAEQITANERKAEGSGANRKTTSQLELLSVFAQTGSVPWWTNSSQPHLLDDCLQYLIHNAPGLLRRLMQELAQEPSSLQRIVHHFEDRLLADLAAVLAPALDLAAFAHLVRDLVLVLQSTTIAAGQQQTQLRHLVWGAIMQQVSLRGEQETAWPPVLRALLIHVAGELGGAYTALLSGMHQVAQQDQSRLQSSIGEITDTLYREMLLTQRSLLPEGDNGVRHSLRAHDFGSSLPSWERDRERGRRGAAQPFVSDTLSLTLSPQGRGEDRVADGPWAKSEPNTIGALSQRERERPHTHGRKDPNGDRWVSLRRLLHSLATQLPQSIQVLLLNALDRLERGATDSDVSTDLIQLLRSETVQQSLPVTLLHRWRAEVERVAVAGFAQGEVLKLTKLLQHVVQEGSSPRRLDKVASLDLTFSDTDELYIDNAGVVILHPFLRYFFARLELLEDKQFKDMASRQRAVGLLQYAVSEDPSPPEYLLPLNKVLCGMELDDVFDFGPPVTEAEAEECTNLLTAVIANAPILKNMSINGLRGTFLLRRGVLSSRDGAWLLRVERETYDVVLDRFPWTMQWVKLPWMDTPLRVEW